jgi:hypothetical protein
VSRTGHTFEGHRSAVRGVSESAWRPAARIEAPAPGGGLFDGRRGKIPKAACVSRPEDASGHSMADCRRPLSGAASGPLKEE